MKRKTTFAIVVVLALIAAACGASDDTTTTAAQATTTTAAAAEETTTSAAAEEGMKTDFGVDVDTMTISLGALHDLTGPFSPLVIPISDAMQVYYDWLNANGGIDGWMIEYIVRDTEYSGDVHREQYEGLRNEVLAITASTGTPTTLAVKSLMEEDNMTYIPLSWYSGWAIPELDQGLGLELGSNYCIEAMNMLEFISDSGGQTIAVISDQGDYGQDAAQGAKLGAEFYGLDVVYDGEGAIIRGQEPTEVIAGIVASGADWVYSATNPTTFATILGGAFQAGYQGMWSGAGPNYNYVLLDSAVGPIVDQVYYQSGYNVLWGDDAPGMVEMSAAMQAAYPDRAPHDFFIIGWNEGVAMTQVLRHAISAGDLTRQGVADAVAAQTAIDFQGTQPNQSYAGTPDEYITRETAIFDPDLATYLAAGGAEQTLSDEGGTTGSLLVKDFFVSEAAAAFEFTEPCFDVS